MTQAPPEYDPATYVPKHPASELDAARHSWLTAYPSSPAALQACETLLGHIFSQPGDRTTRKQKQALGALVADLMEYDAHDQGGWLYRSMEAGSFTAGAVGYRPFRKVYEAMEGMMIEELKGNRVWASNALAPQAPRKVMWQRATRFRATPWLRKWFAERGIDRGTWSNHFKRAPLPAKAAKKQFPIVLKSTKDPRHGGRKGHRLPIDLKDPAVAALASRVDRLNEYLSNIEVAPFGPISFRRIFGLGDDPDHNWQAGGRLYAVGPTPYQTAKRAERAKITVGGEATCELDIRASHLTIMAGLGHIPACAGDPYAIKGLPRSVVKCWITAELGHGKRHTRWPRHAVEEMREDRGIDLAREYPIGPVGDAILRHLPIFDDTGAVPIGWGELQYRESEIILASMEELAFKHDVPALPVHDSLIVPRQYQKVAEGIMRSTFHAHVGIEPRITVKGG